MARGGYRPGSGPKKGTKYKKKGDTSPAVCEGKEDVVENAEAENLTPLEYMLKVMNNPMEPKERRDRMAVSAAPFVHARAGESSGKKAEKEEAAKKAGAGRFAPAAGPKVFPIKKQVGE
jgi:hypothetical protein